MDAELIVHEKFVYEDGAIVEIKAWQISRSKLRPEGYKYSLVYIDPDGNRVIGYDNSKQQGHHKHIRDMQTPIVFESIEKLLQGFLSEVRILRGDKP